ncbi:MAG: argininosuccinate lyase, partial [Chloroflexi bacterium]
MAGSVAHARGLAAAGIITPAQLKAIERGLRRVKRELDEGTFEFAGTDEDIHTAVERRLTELTPAGAALHAGRSRNDQVVTDLRLYCRLASATAVDAIGSLVETLSDAATKHAAWPMPG